MPVISRSKFVQHPRYPEVLHLYNEEFARTGGRLSNNKFYDEVIVKMMPEISRVGWYAFLKKVKTATGMALAIHDNHYKRGNETILPQEPTPSVTISEQRTERAMLTNEEATRQGISAGLNLGARYLQDLLNKYDKDPESLTLPERKVVAEALYKSMKSQDSRIHAIKSVKEDGREQARFDRAFNDASA